MGPIKTLVPIPFAGGIDSKSDPSHVQPGKLADLQNGVFRQTGAVGRRWGYKSLGKSVIGSPSDIAACRALQPFNSELLLFDGQRAYSYISADDAWADKGSIVSVVQSNKQIIAGNSQQLSPDFGTLSGIDVYAWEDSRGGIRYSIIDAATGTLVVTDKPLYPGINAAARSPKVIAFPAASKILVFFDDGYGNVAFIRFDPSNPAAVFGGADTIINGSVGGYLGVDASPVYFDVALAGDGLTVQVAAAPKQPGAGGNIQFFCSALNSSLVVPPAWTTPVSIITGGSTSAITPCALIADAANGNMILLYTYDLAGAIPYVGNAVLLSAYSAATGNGSGLPYNKQVPMQPGALNIEALTGAIVGSQLRIYAETPPGPGSDTTRQRIWTNTVNTATFVVGPTPTAPFQSTCGLASKPFIYGGRIYLNVAYQSQLQSTYFTIDDTGNVVGKVFSGLCGGLIRNSDYMLPECVTIRPGVFKYANLVKGFPNTEAGQVLALLGVNATTLDFFDSNNFLSATVNGSLYVVGGILQVYDGAQFVELNFNVYPETIPLVASTGGGQSAGKYYYAVTYEWTDNNDRVDISTPSPVVSITLTAGQSVVLTLPTLSLTKKQNVKIVVYRTQANGTLLYRVTSAALPVYNNTAVDSISFTDVLSDASIVSNGLMYSQPLVQGSNPVAPNASPPSCSLIATYADRLFIGGLDDPYTLWYSQTSIEKSPMQFSSILTLRTDPDGGPISGIQRLDNNFIVFKSNAIFYMSGQGPTATGDASDFGAPTSVPSGQVGCVSQASIVETPVGLLFQSANGIYLLDRGLNVSYKGAPVEKFNALSITSATLVPNQWIVFTTTTGLALVYDYFYDQWSTFTAHTAADSALYLGAGNLFVFAQPDGKVLLQTPTVFSDDGVPIAFSLTTAAINPGALGGGIQGYQRIYHALLLGTYRGTHNLNVGVAFDYDQTFTALAAIPVDATLGITVYGVTGSFGADPYFGGAYGGQNVYQFRLDILRKCQAVQFQISDAQPAPGNEGFSLSALSLIVGVKPGGNRVPAIKQFGVA